MFDWLFVEYPTRRELIRELRKTRMTNMAIFDDVSRNISDIKDLLRRHLAGDEARMQKRLDALRAELDAKYDHDVGALNAQVEELKAMLGSFEPSNN